VGSNQAATVAASITPQLTYFLTSKLQASAKSAGWPEDVVSKLYVTESNGSFFVAYPDYLATQVNELEYGTEGSVPRSAIRSFASRLGSKPAEILADATLEMFLEGAI
jgi:hypothetical protein